jgi:diguanylate cyclase (GGDEF)-like protein/PAS domain S-box-containing protein
VVGWNEGARILNGYDASDIIGEHFSLFYTAEEIAVGHPERELDVAAAVGSYQEEGWRVRKDGSRFWAHVVITAIWDGEGHLQGFGNIIKDFTDRKQAAEQSANMMKLLEYTARTDFLTGLDNRRSLETLLTRSVSAALRNGGHLCVGMIDLDMFKTFNDAFGHQAGDAFLKQAVARWRETLRPHDVIARFGGEEFVTLLPDTKLQQAAAVLERLRSVTPAPITCSVGVAEWDGTESEARLIGRADRALFQAKAGGRDRIELSPAPNMASQVQYEEGQRRARGSS